MLSWPKWVRMTQCLVCDQVWYVNMCKTKSLHVQWLRSATDRHTQIQTLYKQLCDWLSCATASLTKNKTRKNRTKSCTALTRKHTTEDLEPTQYVTEPKTQKNNTNNSPRQTYNKRVAKVIWQRLHRTPSILPLGTWTHI